MSTCYGVCVRGAARGVRAPGGKGGGGTSSALNVARAVPSSEVTIDQLLRHDSGRFFYDWYLDAEYSQASAAKPDLASRPQSRKRG